MGRRLRCSECRRLTIRTSSPPAYEVTALEPHVITLLRLAREFDDQGEPGECYTAVDFVDMIALTIHAESGYTVPAKSGDKDKAA